MALDLRKGEAVLIVGGPVVGLGIVAQDSPPEQPIGLVSPYTLGLGAAPFPTPVAKVALRKMRELVDEMERPIRR